MSVPAATIRAMPGDLEPLPARLGGLDRDQVHALADAAADTGAQALRTAAVARLLLLHNAQRVDEACAADIAITAEQATFLAWSRAWNAAGSAVIRH